MPKRLTSSLARRIAAQSGIDLFSLVAQGCGTGPRHRIMAHDVWRYLAEEQSKSTPNFLYAHATIESFRKKPIKKPEREIFHQCDKPLEGNDCSYALPLEMAPFLSLTHQINIQTEKLLNFSYEITDFLIQAVVMACQTVPKINALYDWKREGVLIRNHIDVNLVSYEKGKLTYVTAFDAQEKSVLDMAQEIREVRNIGAGTINLIYHSYCSAQDLSQAEGMPDGAIISLTPEKDEKVSRRSCKMTLSVWTKGDVVSQEDVETFLEALRVLIETPSLVLL